ncbi:MAG TPA: malto-oligosyltrehalose synthase [Candidatus Saccharimonadales bacterium]|nr:malto-oligosyltrehalose synthase [Candidatus Saccharimonadales bacterium]
MRVQPRATYRVQMREEFDFDAAAAVVPYLERLGISHLYCSPYMRATPHSAHGYDTVDPTRISLELGGERGLASLDAALRSAHMGQLLDIVPNHMCISDPANRWWWDVLRTGRSSPFATMFDIDWDAPAAGNRVLLPVLRDPLEDILERGELLVAEGSDGLELDYGGSRFPLAPGTAASTGPATLELLGEQHYVLGHWLTAAALLNYRRFFDVSSLAGLRVEHAAVFSAVLGRALELVDHGVVDGLRIDHIDGLAGPAAFAERLRRQAPDTWIIAEKILAMEERLPAWPIDGTTGYDFTAVMTTLLVDPQGVSDVVDCYRDFSGDHLDFAEHSNAARRDVLESLLAAELGRLTRAAESAGIPGARTELAELLSAMPVYRLYPRGDEPLCATDGNALHQAAETARQRGRCDTTRLSALITALSSREHASMELPEFRTRFQQVAGAVMAKGVEDTAFYRYLPLVALNEVGADPGRTTTVDGFHDFCRRAATDHPLSLLATATHDTKRGEDARLRLLLLSEIPDEWHALVMRLHASAERYRHAAAPSRKAEYLLFQTLVAAWPIDADRMCAYMRKASREGKEDTNWLEPNEAYETALERFVRDMLADPHVGSEISRFVAALTPHWQELSLSQTLLKLTAPGIPDIYQGCELWDLRLVDPDNRTPVDFTLRQDLLRTLDAETGDDFMSRFDEGVPKLRLIATSLAVRARHADAFAPGSGYAQLAVEGSRSQHAICFSRTTPDNEPTIVTVAFRWPLRLGGAWHDTTLHLPAGSWQNAFTGQELTGGEQAFGDVLAQVPVALLERG